MSVQTFVTTHDQDLVLKAEAEGRFADLNNVTYLFVGPRPVDRIPDDVDLIVSRVHTGNIEQFPQLYDFTGWWTVARHRLIRADKIMCIQYDMRPAGPTTEADVSDALDLNEMVAFTPGHRSASNWMLLIQGFEEAFSDGLADNDAVMPSDDFEEWPSTQGTAWRTESFYAFMNWVRPMLDCWANSVWAGHLAERSVKAWLTNTGRTEGYVHGAIHHEHRDCHGTCALMGGNTAVYAERATTFGR